MNHFDNADRKNVNVLGEEELTKVVGGWGGHGRRHGGGRRQQGGGGGSSAMRKHGGSGRNQGQNDDRVVVNVIVIKFTINQFGDVVAGAEL